MNPQSGRARLRVAPPLVTYLLGIRPREWWRLLAENRFRVTPRYWPRAALVTAMSLVNSIAAVRDERQFDAAGGEERPIEPPLFILGHWGSGTTNLHYLFAQDRRFAYPNLYDVTHPHTLLAGEPLARRIYGPLLPQRRVWDNVRVSADMPGEDEFATALLCGRSPYHGWSFPRRERDYDRYLSFDEAAPAELDQWRQALVWFARRLTAKYDRPLVLKSPPHTARTGHLLGLFPGAKFVHLHRNPIHVFQTTRRFYDRALAYFRLQRPDPATIDAGIIRRYAIMYEAYFRDRPRIPAGRLCEVAFEDLEADPLHTMERIYSALDLPTFDETRPAVAAYLESNREYKKNEHAALDPKLVARIAQAWRPCFDEWGYDAGP